LRLEQAVDHSVSQLRLLMAAAKRIRADETLTEFHAMHAAFAAVMCGKDGQRAAEKFQQRLVKQSEPEKT